MIKLHGRRSCRVLGGQLRIVDNFFLFCIYSKTWRMKRTGCFRSRALAKLDYILLTV